MTSSLQTAYDQTLAKNSKLQYLAVLAQDFSFCDNDARWAHLECRNCMDQRVQATRALAMACIGLKRCRWKNCHAQSSFIVRNSLEENTPAQGVKSVLFPDQNKYDDDSDIVIVLP